MHHSVTRRIWEALPPERKGDFWAAYVYLKYTGQYVNAAMEAAGFERQPRPPLDPAIEEMLHALVWHVGEAAGSTDTSLYHAKVVRPHDARKLVTQKEDLHLSPPERVIPFKVAREVVLESPDAIALGVCPCRSQSPHPCLPPGEQDVCLFLGEPWVSFLEEQNASYRRISQDEAVAVLDRCHEKGFVHAAYFEHAVGNRLDAICNCCGCCCMGVRMWNVLGGAVPILAPSGYVAEVSEDCTGCGMCLDQTCIFGAISQSDPGQPVAVDQHKCMGCGVCENTCPMDALHLRRDPSKGDPLDLDELQQAR